MVGVIYNTLILKNNWRPYGQATKKIEDAYLPKIMRVIKTFRASFISDLQNHGTDTARANLNLSLIDEGMSNVLLSIYRTAGLMGAKMTAKELKALAMQKAGGFGRNEQWIEQVIGFLRLHMMNILGDMTQTMKDDILRVLQESIDNGWSISETVAKLKEEGLIEARARVIARTEINKAANQGHRAAASTTPYEVDKGWSAAKDHRTRHSHQKVNGQLVGEDDTFQVEIYKGDKLVGHEQMIGPGDPNASAGNIINCRCRAYFVPKRDTAGNLIMRNPNAARIVPMRTPSTILTPGQIAAVLKSNIEIGVK